MKLSGKSIFREYAKTLSQISYSWSSSSSNLKVSRGGSRGRVQGVRTPPEMTCSLLIQLVFYKKKKKKTMSFIGVEEEQEMSAPPPKKNPGSAPGL